MSSDARPGACGSPPAGSSTSGLHPPAGLQVGEAGRGLRPPEESDCNQEASVGSAGALLVASLDLGVRPWLVWLGWGPARWGVDEVLAGFVVFLLCNLCRYSQLFGTGGRAPCP